MSGWPEIASRPEVLRRALSYGVVVGAILVGINHGDALLRGDIDGVRLTKILLTPLVPFCVSLLSSISALRNTAPQEMADSTERHGQSGVENESDT